LNRSKSNFIPGGIEQQADIGWLGIFSQNIERTFQVQAGLLQDVDGPAKNFAGCGLSKLHGLHNPRAKLFWTKEKA